MTESFADKANKGRCLAFPGYCDKTINTCNLAHPLINCDRYPACFNPKCTYLHPVCNFDCRKQLCKKIACKDFHPWRDSYRTKKGKLPDPRGDDVEEFATIPDSATVNELIAKYQKEYNEGPSNVKSSSTTITATMKTQQSDNPIEEQIMNVRQRIIEMNLHETIKDRKFMKGKCFDCAKAPATIILLNCCHLVFCKQCFSKNPKCLLCGKKYQNFIDVYA